MADLLRAMISWIARSSTNVSPLLLEPRATRGRAGLGFEWANLRCSAERRALAARFPAVGERGARRRQPPVRSLSAGRGLRVRLWARFAGEGLEQRPRWRRAPRPRRCSPPPLLGLCAVAVACARLGAREAGQARIVDSQPSPLARFRWPPCSDTRVCFQIDC